MTIADKILNLRKTNNLSQEELAEKLGVSRQSVSKWESAASIPDITKIMALAKLFSVATDYLLDDELEMPQYTGEVERSTEHLVTIEEANRLIATTKKYARKLALGVAFCILSPTLLIFLTTVAEENASNSYISVDMASIFGLIFLFLFVAVAVSIFIIGEADIKPLQYFKKSDFELSFGVSGIVKERQSAFLPVRTKTLVMNVVLLMFSALPLVVVSFFSVTQTFLIGMLMVLFFVVAIGVCNLIICEAEKKCYEQLLGEGEYNRASMGVNKKKERINGIYWSVVLAVYLGWSLWGENWGITWIVWPVAALLYSAISAIFVRE